MTEIDLHDLIGDEPPFLLAPDSAIASGRRRRRRRQGAVLGTFVLTAGVVGSGALLLSNDSTPATSTVLAADPTASAAPADDNDGSSYYRIVRANTPAGWTFTEPDSDAGGWWATVDDGNGAGRFGMFRSTGSLQLHPCSDSEFRSNGTCVETELSPTSRLIVRGPNRWEAFSSAQVVIVHPDGSGVDVSIDNATWPDLPSGTRFTTADEKREATRGTVHRHDVVYSNDQLVAIAKAFDAAT
jgi:hypothetical protein